MRRKTNHHLKKSVGLDSVQPYRNAGEYGRFDSQHGIVAGRMIRGRANACPEAREKLARRFIELDVVPADILAARLFSVGHFLSGTYCAGRPLTGGGVYLGIPNNRFSQTSKNTFQKKAMFV